MQTYMKISTLSQLTIATECLQRQLEQWDISAEKKMDIRLCVMEAVQNGLLYGSAEGQPPEVHLSWQCNCDGFSFFVEDNGSGVPERQRSGRTARHDGRGCRYPRRGSSTGGTWGRR